MFTKDTLTLSTFIFIAATVGFSGSIVFGETRGCDVVRFAFEAGRRKRR